MNIYSGPEIYFDKGYISCFDMINADDGKRQLMSTVNELRKAGHKRIFAPIDGDTWHKYRLVSSTDGEPAFPLEPQNPLWYNDVYMAAGFTPIKRYVSEIFAVTGTTEDVPGVTIRGFDKEDLKGELARVYKLSLEGFEDNFLYSPISADGFYAMYTPVLPMLDSEYALFAEIGGETAGFLFAYVSAERLILKTIVVLPKFRKCGVGGALVSHALASAVCHGISRAVAALISDDNNSRKLAARYNSRVMREYTLYHLEM